MKLKTLQCPYCTAEAYYHDDTDETKMRCQRSHVFLTHQVRVIKHDPPMMHLWGDGASAGYIFEDRDIVVHCGSPINGFVIGDLLQVVAGPLRKDSELTRTYSGKNLVPVRRADGHTGEVPASYIVPVITLDEDGLESVRSVFSFPIPAGA